MKKYELTDDSITFMGRKLFRIRAIRSFNDVAVGDLGGFVEKEENLSHDNDAWIYGDARISDNACICDNACIYGDADYLYLKGLGSENRNTTFFKCEDGHIHVSCGCFSGNLAEFETKVKKTHGDSKYAKEYLACIEVVKIHFKEENK